MHDSPVDVISVEIIKNYIIKLQFDDGCSGIVDISKIVPFKAVFEPLNDQHFFNTVFVNPEIGTICWKNGADLSPDYLRENVEQKNIRAHWLYLACGKSSLVAKD